MTGRRSEVSQRRQRWRYRWHDTLEGLGPAELSQVRYRNARASRQEHLGRRDWALGGRSWPRAGEMARCWGDCATAKVPTYLAWRSGVDRRGARTGLARWKLPESSADTVWTALGNTEEAGIGAITFGDIIKLMQEGGFDHTNRAATFVVYQPLPPNGRQQPVLRKQRPRFPRTLLE